MSLPLRLEVQTGTSTWLDVLGRTNSISVSRSPMNLGTLSARILDTALDPSQTATLASGKAIRLHALTPAGWRPVYTGKISASRVTYAKPEPGADPSKAARIEVQAVDAMQPLGAAIEPRSVHTANNLRTLLGASSVAWRVNGTTTAGPSSPLIVANNPGAFLADQVAITRDTLRGYAWVDASNVLQVYEPGSMPSALTATYTDLADGHPSFSEVDAAYDSTDIVDEVSVTFLVYKTSANAVEEVTHTLRRPGSTGTNTRTYTIVGGSMTAAQIKTYCETYAQAVLDRHATAVVRPLGLTTPVRTDAERAAAVAAEPCSLVRVKVDGRVDAQVRIESVEHQITAVQGQPDPVQWLASYTYDRPNAVPEAQALSLVKSAPVLDRLAATETVATKAADPADTAARLSGQVLSDVRTSAVGSPGWVLGETGNTLTAKTGLSSESSAGGLAVEPTTVGGVQEAITALRTSLLSDGSQTKRAAITLRANYNVRAGSMSSRAEIAADLLDLPQINAGFAGYGSFYTDLRDRITANAQAVASATVTAVSPFSADSNATPRVERFGELVILTGVFLRSSGGQTSFVRAGTIPFGYRPARTTFSPAAVIFGTSNSFQGQADTDGAFYIRMSTAFTAGMPFLLAWRVA